MLSSHTTPVSRQLPKSQIRLEGTCDGHTSLLITHIVNFVINNPRDLSHDFGAAVEHGAENLSGHDETGGSRVYRHVASHQSHIFELLLLPINQSINANSRRNTYLQISVLLI
jgi:hypothetical protein